MTDKQIIIDGVDVSGCIHYKNRTCIADYCLTDMPFGEAKCEKSPNCHYKQLKRKEQECEAYKMEAEEGKEINAELKAENEELKKILNEGCLHNLTLMTEQRVLLQTLTEIKEIAEDFGFNGTYESYKTAIDQILQKISECEVNDEQ